MKVTTLRLPESLYEDLEAEADERGVSVSEYVRSILCDRPNTQANTEATTPNTETAAGANTRANTPNTQQTEANTDLVEQVVTLAARVDELEAAVNADDDQDTDRVDRGTAVEHAGPDRDDRAAALAVPTDETPPVTEPEASARVRAAVDAEADSWDDTRERIEARRAAAVAVLSHAVESGEAVGKSDAVDDFRPTYPVEGQNAETWWRKNIRPILSEYGDYSQGAHGYRVTEDDLPPA